MKVKNTHIILLGVLAGAGLFSVGEVDALSYQNNVNVNFSFNPAVTIALSGTKGTDLIIDGLSPGSASDSNIITVTAGSNSGVGYYLYASAGSATSGDTYYDTNALKNGSNTFTSLTSNVGTLNALTAGQWGYTYSAHDANTWVSGNVGSTSSGYNGLPKATSGNGVTLLNASTVGTAELDFKIAAKADSNQASGTYSNVINFSAVAKPVTTNYTITYYDGDTAMSTPAPVAGTISSGNDTTVTLNSSATKFGYTLGGWCYGTLTNGNCSGTIYQPGDSYTVGNIGGTATINLYAMWKTGPKIYMQDLTLANCPTTIATVYDKRDESPYRIQKLADNKCWMLDNLALDLTALTQAQLYGTDADAGKMTNATNEALGYLKGATTGTASDKWAMAAVKKTWTSSYSYSQPWIAVDSTTSGGCNDTFCVNGGSAGSPWSYDSETSATINGETSIAQGKIGVYYNYCAVSAGSYCWGNDTSYTGSPSSDSVSGSLRDITDDICPYRWRLPTSGSGGELQALYDQYSSGSPDQMTAFQTALSTPLSGYFYSGKAFNQGDFGNFWSSTWYDTSGMDRLFVDSSSVFPSDRGSRYFGDSVRCILAE